MRLVVVEGIDLDAVAAAVGPSGFARGSRSAQRGAVLYQEWDAAQGRLRAVVRGADDRGHSTSVYFTPRPDSRLVFAGGDCSCAEGFDCEHVVAAALTAAGPTSAAKAPSPPAPPTWDQTLGALLEPQRSTLFGASETTPLAVELSLSEPAPGVTRYRPEAGPRLLARLLKPGRTGWVGGGLTWGKLESPYQLGESRADHVRLLKELYALYRARSGPSHHYSSYREEKTIDLAEFGSPQLWSILDEAAAIGVTLVHSRRRLGAVAPYGRAELGLDVTAGEEPGSLVVAPVLNVEGRADDGTEGGEEVDVVPIAFIGSGGNGVVHVPAAQIRAGVGMDEWRFRLARLAAPVPAPLQRMAREGGRLPIPAAEHERFRAEFYPKLRALAPVGSSDGSFSPPPISEPTLLLHAAYGEGHDLALRWEWSYDVGEASVRAPLGPPGPDDGHRDLAAERVVLDALDVGLERFGLRGPAPERALAPRAELAGLDTMRFSTEVLPLLTSAAGVAVEVTGEPAEYRESGDSVRIGVSADAVAGQTDWFDLGVSVTVEGREVPFAELFTALAADESELLLADGAYFSLQKPELQALRTLIEEARALQDAPGRGLRISRYQASLWDELSELGVVERQAAVWKQQVAGLLSLESLPAVEPPAALAAQLRPYQVAGLRWLAFLWRFGLGGILADDMGLGKTLQSLALICHAKQSDPEVAPFLIVAPTSVVGNWAAEAARFAPGLRVVAVSDTLRRRGQELATVVAGADVVVTSYTLFRLDFEAYAAAQWSGLLLDEAQFAKNHQSKVHQCARKLPAPFKLAITGTPMENNLMELWSLLSITAPGLFPSPTRFREHYARPIERQSDAELLARLRRRIKPLVTRRTKEQVAAELPAKQEQVLDVELDPRHRRIYQRHLQRERQKVLGLIDDVERNRFTILRSLTLLRQLSLHPGLIDAEHLELASAKIEALVEQLDEVVRGGHRALVFSQFTGFLGLVRERLDAAGVGYSYLDGKTRDRPAVIAAFKDGRVPVFLISLKAGGFGLNLTEADYCFLLDPWWNPATEAQAVDRTHRIGQTRNVHVYRLIAKDTIEEKVRALASRKAALFTGVMDEGNVFGAGLSAADIRELLG